MIALRGVDRIPKVEAWPEIMADLGYPGPVVVGRSLDVDPLFVDGWNRAGSAPKWACLALYWLTTWGRAEVHAEAVRDAQLLAQCLRAVERERDQLLRDANRQPGRPLIAEPRAFERLPFANAPVPAGWGDPVSAERQAPAGRFLAGAKPKTKGKPRAPGAATSR